MEQRKPSPSRIGFCRGCSMRRFGQGNQSITWTWHPHRHDSASRLLFAVKCLSTALTRHYIFILASLLLFPLFHPNFPTFPSKPIHPSVRSPINISPALIALKVKRLLRKLSPSLVSALLLLPAAAVWCKGNPSRCWSTSVPLAFEAAEGVSPHNRWPSTKCRKERASVRQSQVSQE